MDVHQCGTLSNGMTPLCRLGKCTHQGLEMTITRHWSRSSFRWASACRISVYVVDANLEWTCSIASSFRSRQLTYSLCCCYRRAILWTWQYSSAASFTSVGLLPGRAPSFRSSTLTAKWFRMSRLEPQTVQLQYPHPDDCLCSGTRCVRPSWFDKVRVNAVILDSTDDLHIDQPGLRRIVIDMWTHKFNTYFAADNTYWHF